MTVGRTVVLDSLDQEWQCRSQVHGRGNYNKMIYVKSVFSKQ